MKKAIPAYSRHATGQAYVRLGGRFIYLGLYGTPESRERYQRAVAQWIDEGTPTRWAGPTPKARTVADVMLAYLAHVDAYYQRDGRPTSEVAIVESALSFLERMFSTAHVNEFNAAAFRLVRQSMVREGLARSTVNSYATRIKRMFRWAVARDLVPGSVYAVLSAVEGLAHGRSGARETERVGPVDESDVEKTIERLPERLRAPVRLQLLTGMRPGEVLAMRPMDVERGRDVWTYRPAHHKNAHRGASREVYLGPRAQAILAPLLVRAAQDAPLFDLRRDSYRRAIARAAKRAGVPAWSPHQLRHTAATRFRRMHGIEKTRVLLGHAALETSEIYAEADEATAREIAKSEG